MGHILPCLAAWHICGIYYSFSSRSAALPHSIGKTRLPPGLGVDGIRRQRLSEIILEGGGLLTEWHPLCVLAPQGEGIHKELFSQRQKGPQLSGSHFSYLSLWVHPQGFPSQKPSPEPDRAQLWEVWVVGTGCLVFFWRNFESQANAFTLTFLQH